MRNEIGIIRYAGARFLALTLRLNFAVTRFPQIYNAVRVPHHPLVQHLSLRAQRSRHATAAASSLESDLRHRRTAM